MNKQISDLVAKDIQNAATIERMDKQISNLMAKDAQK